MGIVFRRIARSPYLLAASLTLATLFAALEMTGVVHAARVVASNPEACLAAVSGVVLAVWSARRGLKSGREDATDSDKPNT